MNNQFAKIIMGLGIVFGVSESLLRSAEAQVVLQQPVVQGLGGSTTVSVPDGGQVLLGGVTSARSARSSFGFGPRPFRPTAYGFERSASSMVARTRIIDLHELDAAVLALGDPDFRGDGWADRTRRPSNARHQALAGNSAAAPISYDSAPPEAPRAVKRDPVDQYQRLAKLAEEADQRGKRALARVYRQEAEKLLPSLPAEIRSKLLAVQEAVGH